MMTTNVYRVASADAKVQHEKLQAQQAQLKSAISTTTGRRTLKIAGPARSHRRANRRE
jgi:hypothetical protein